MKWDSLLFSVSRTTPLLVSFSHAVFFLSSFFTKTFKIYALHPSTLFKALIFICTKKFLNCSHVFALTRIHIKVKWISLKLSLNISTILCSNFFLFHLKEICLPTNPVYWFPIRNQQSREQCLLDIHSLSWIYECECLKVCIPVTTTQRSSLIIVLWARECLGELSWLFSANSGLLQASLHIIIKGNRERGSLPGLVSGKFYFSHTSLHPSGF